MYILNLVLGCWLSEREGEPPSNNYLIPDRTTTMEGLVEHWNRHPNTWSAIHYPARIEHFEAYEKLSTDWNKEG